MTIDVDKVRIIEVTCSDGGVFYVLLPKKDVTTWMRNFKETLGVAKVVNAIPGTPEEIYQLIVGEPFSQAQ